MKLEDIYQQQLLQATDSMQIQDLQQKLSTVKWLREKIAPINAGRFKHQPGARVNCTLVAEECVKVLSGKKNPDLIPAKKINLTTTWRKDTESNEVVYHEVHREEQFTIIGMQEFNEVIELLDDKPKVQVDLENLTPRSGIKYITTKRSQIAVELKALPGNSISHGTDKTLTGIIFYYYRNSNAGHLANFFRDAYGHLFFVDAQCEIIAEEPPTKVFNYNVAEEVFYFILSPTQGFYMKKEINEPEIKIEPIDLEDRVIMYRRKEYSSVSAKKRGNTDIETEQTDQKRIKLEHNETMDLFTVTKELFEKLMTADLKTLEQSLIQNPKILLKSARYNVFNTILGPFKNEKRGLLSLILRNKTIDQEQQVRLIFDCMEKFFSTASIEEAKNLPDVLDYNCFRLLNSLILRAKGIADLPEKFLKFYVKHDQQGIYALKFLKDAIWDEAAMKFFFAFYKQHESLILPIHGYYELLELQVSLFKPNKMPLSWQRTLNLILRSYPKPKPPTPNNLLIAAITQGLPVKFLERLIDSDNINYTNEQGMSALGLAISQQNLSLIKLLFQYNADPSKTITFNNKVYNSAFEFAKAVDASENIIHTIKKQLQAGKQNAKTTQNFDTDEKLSRLIM